MIYMGIDPSTSSTGIAVLDENKKLILSKVLDSRKNKVNGKGQELKSKSSFSIDDFVKNFKQILNSICKEFKSEKIVVVLPIMSGFLNYNTIDKLSRLSGIIHGIVCNKKNISVCYVNENSARSRVLKNISGDSYKDKAKKLSNISSDDIADAFVLATCYIDYQTKEPDIFKLF